jgi:hypothetical protein
VNEVPFDAHQAFVTADQFMPPALDANGETPLGEAVSRALALLRDRKEVYKQNGLDYFRPWIFTITDGRPTDRGWEAVAEQVRQEEARKGVIFYGVGVEGADLEVLAPLLRRAPAAQAARAGLQRAVHLALEEPFGHCPLAPRRAGAAPAGGLGIGRYLALVSARPQKLAK